MNKYDFLKKLSLDELNLAEDITHNDVLTERNSRKEQSNPFKFKVGDCFKNVHSNGDIFLFRIEEINDNWVNCTEIQIFTDGDFEYYELFIYCHD